MANVADTIYSVVAENLSGTTPATPAFKYFEVTDASFNLESSMLSSAILKPNRAAGDSSEQGFYVTGNFKTDFCRDTAIDLWLENGFGGSFTANVLKAGGLDKTLTVEQKMVFSGGAGYFRYTGVQATDLGITVDATSKVEFSGNVIGLAQTTGSAIIPSATYTPPVKGSLFTSGGAGSITVAGITGAYYSLDFKTAHQRSPKFALFNSNAIGISTGANRAASVTLQLYRDDFNPESVFASNTPIAVSFSFGSGNGNVYTFNMPRCIAKRPQRATSDNSELVSVELTAANDTTAATDVSVTRS